MTTRLLSLNENRDTCLLFIFRDNLAIESRFWYLRSFFINSFLFVVLFFLTTPAIVVSSLDVLTIITNHIEKMVSFPIQTFPLIDKRFSVFLFKFGSGFLN